MGDADLQDWFRGPLAHPGRTAVHRAALEARALGVALLRADAEHLAEDDLDDVVDLLRRARERLGALPSLPEGSTPAGTREAPTFLTERSPVSGRANVAAAPLVLEHGPGVTRGVATFTELHEGPAGHVHGGVIAAVFDELLGVAQVHSGAAGYTVELDVRFHRITPLFVPVVHEARILDRDDRRIRVRGTSFRQVEPDRLLASAVGTFVAQAHLSVQGPVAPG